MRWLPISKMLWEQKTVSRDVSDCSFTDPCGSTEKMANFNPVSKLYYKTTYYGLKMKDNSLHPDLIKKLEKNWRVILASW